jgi:DNA primase
MTTKKYLFPKGFNVKHYIFGLYELYRYGDTTKPVIVCESVIDALTCWEFGYQAIAIYSAMISMQQLDLLVKSPFRLFKDGFDRDEAGRLGWKVFKEHSIPKGLRVVESKDHNKKDINELSYEEFLRWVN